MLKAKNNRIQQIKRMACGFRNIVRFVRTRISWIKKQKDKFDTQPACQKNNRVVRKLQFLNKFRLKTAKYEVFCKTCSTTNRIAEQVHYTTKNDCGVFSLTWQKAPSRLHWSVEIRVYEAFSNQSFVTWLSVDLISVF